MAATLVTVAVTVGLLLVVTGIALALADGGAATNDDGDAHIVPDEQASLSAVDGVEGTRLGETNDRAEELRAHEGVDHASPILAEPGHLEAVGSGEPQTVLLVGVLPDEEPRTVAGLSTSSLGDTEAGSEDGQPHGEIVLSEATADRLEASEGDELSVPDPEATANVPSLSVTVTAVEEADSDGDTDAPVALVYVTDLQSFSGAENDQLADRVTVWGDEEAISAIGAETFPEATVESQRTTDPRALFDDGLALAASVLALLVGLVICSSFIATTAGMSVNDDRRSLAVLESVGIPRRGRLTVVAVSTLATTVVGAILGVALGFAGIYGLDIAASATVAPGTVAVAHPVFAPYAVGVALLAGLIAIPYPLAIAARTSALEEVNR